MSKGTDEILTTAQLRHQKGRLAEAESLYREVLAADRQNVMANNLLGLLYLQSRRFPAAVRRIRAALAIDDRDAQAHFNLGLALAEMRELGAAARHFRRSTDLSPGNPEAHNALGNALRLGGDFHAAVGHFERALELAPTHPGIRQNLSLACNQLGVAANRAGDPAKAIAHFERAVKLVPRNAEAQLNLGITLDQFGRQTDAARALRAAIHARQNLVEAHYQLVHLKGLSPTREQMEAMEQVLESSTLDDEERRLMFFALGEAHDRTGDYDSAFRYFAQAQAIKGKAARSRVESDAESFAAIRKVFGSDLLRARQSEGHTDTTPILVVGMPRSGTTLVEQILASHPDVHGAGEIDALPRTINEFLSDRRTGYPGGIDVDGARLAEFGRSYVRKLREFSATAQRICDKAPMNFKYLGLVAAALPEARIVHCVRDPLDTCLSIYMHPLADAHDYAHDLRDLGSYYRLYRDLMAHWKHALRGRICEIRYEDLVADPETEIRKLLAACDLEFDARCLAFHETRRFVQTPSASQVRQPMYRSSVGRSAHYAEHLKRLREALCDADTTSS